MTATTPGDRPGRRVCMTLAQTRAAAEADADAARARGERLTDAAIQRCIAILAPHIYPDMTAAPAAQQEPLNTRNHERTRSDATA